jgi:hypothetical protein
LTARQVERYSLVYFDESTVKGILIVITDENRVAALEEKIRIDLIPLIVSKRQALQEIKDTIEV